jgi:hypothetical protein
VNLHASIHDNLAYCHSLPSSRLGVTFYPVQLLISKP